PMRSSGAYATVRMTALKIGIVGLVAFAIILASTLVKPGPPVSIIVRGFVTNRYSTIMVRNGESPDYVCAIIAVTNTSKDTFICSPKREGYFPTGGSTGSPVQKPYYAYGDGGFRNRRLPPDSGFCFEVLVWRDSTNQ